MMINMSRHCDFIASSVKFICAESNQENSDTMKVIGLDFKLIKKVSMNSQKGVLKYLP